MPPPQRATPARKGARYGAGVGSQHPYQPHPGHTGRGTPAARPRGRAAGRGTAPDTRRPSQRWQAIPPRDGPPPPPRHAAPTGHAGQGNQCWAPTPTHPRPQHRGGGPHQPAQWAGSRGRASAWPQTPLTTVEGTPPGEALPPPHSEQRWPARAHAVGLVLGPPARTDRTRGTWVAKPWPPAPEDGRLGGGTAPDTRRPSQLWQATPPRGRPPATLAARSPHRACRAREQC